MCKTVPLAPDHTMIDGVVTVHLVSGVTDLLILSDALLLVTGDAMGRVVVAGVAVTQMVTEV